MKPIDEDYNEDERIEAVKERRHMYDLGSHPDCRDPDHPGCPDCED